MDLEIGSLASGGLVLGANPVELPPNIFSYVENVEFTRKGVRPLRQPSPRNFTVPGARLVYRAVDTQVNGGVRVVLLFCEDKVYVFTGFSFVDVTPDGMVSSFDWSVTEYNGYVVACNGQNFPYYYDFADSYAQLKVLPNWPQSLIPKRLSSLNNFLIFMGLVSDGTFANQIIVWSDAADLGSLPSDYDWANPASRAGFYTLPNFEEFVSAQILNKSLIVYRSNSIYEMRFIGGTFVFSIDPRFDNKPLFNSHTVATRGRVQYCVGKTEFYAHDGATDSVFDVRPVADYFFENVNLSYKHLARLVYDSSEDRLHLIYPHGNSTLCDRDLFFDFKSNCWSLSVLSGYSYVGTEFFSKTIPIRYETATTSYGDTEGDYVLRYEAFSDNELVYMNGSIFQVGGESQVMAARLTRSIVAYNAQDQSGGVTVKRNLNMLVTELWPKLTNGTLQFRLGFSQTELGAISWSDWQSPVDNLRADFFESGTYLHFEARNLNSDFTFTGYMLKAAPIGRPL